MRLKSNIIERQFRNDFLIKLKRLKINKTKNVYVSSNLSKLAKFNIPKEKILTTRLIWDYNMIILKL